TVVDGTSLLILEFTGFDAGEKLVFTIDVDEVQHLDPGVTDVTEINDGLDPIASGAEFHGSLFKADFTAPDFYPASGAGTFINKYDPLLAGKNLDLPADDETGHRDRSDGVALVVPQEPILACISGYVYHDRNNNGLREAGEEG